MAKTKTKIPITKDAVIDALLWTATHDEEFGGLLGILKKLRAWDSSCSFTLGILQHCLDKLKKDCEEVEADETWPLEYPGHQCPEKPDTEPELEVKTELYNLLYAVKHHSNISFLEIATEVIDSYCDCHATIKVMEDLMPGLMADCLQDRIERGEWTDSAPKGGQENGC